MYWIVIVVSHFTISGIEIIHYSLIAFDERVTEILVFIISLEKHDENLLKLYTFWTEITRGIQLA